MNLNIHPKGYRILVKADEIEEETEAGIFIVQDKNMERAAQMKGTLVAVGEYAWDRYDNPWAKVGDCVLYAKHSGKNVEDPVTKENYVIMNDEDLIAVLERGE